MFKRILASSLQYVAEHPMLIRIAFLTWFVHTLFSFWRLWYTFYVILEANVDIGDLEGSLMEYVRAIFDVTMNNISFGTLVFLWFLWVIWYVILYPIGHAMMVAYAQTGSKIKSFNIAFKRYFTVTITEGILAVITFWSWHLFAMRYFYHRWILDNILIQIFLTLMGGFLLVTSFIYSYANINSVMDNFTEEKPSLQAREALKNSAKIAMEHPFITLKFLLLSLLLEIRFFLTTILVIGVPVLVMRLLLQIGLIDQESVITVVLITAWVLLIASIYINSVIDAFFTVYRYKLYKELTDNSLAQDSSSQEVLT